MYKTCTSLLYLNHYPVLFSNPSRVPSSVMSLTSCDKDGCDGCHRARYRGQVVRERGRRRARPFEVSETHWGMIAAASHFLQASPVSSCGVHGGHAGVLLAEQLHRQVLRQPVHEMVFSVVQHHAGNRNLDLHSLEEVDIQVHVAMEGNFVKERVHLILARGRFEMIYELLFQIVPVRGLIIILSLSGIIPGQSGVLEHRRNSNRPAISRIVRVLQAILCRTEPSLKVLITSAGVRLECDLRETQSHGWWGRWRCRGSLRSGQHRLYQRL